MITFPGYSAYGDSYWRLERNDVTGGLDAPVANEVFDYWRHEADVGVDYRLSRMLSVGVEGGWEGWRYDHLRLDQLDEYSIGASFAVKPSRGATLKGALSLLGPDGRGLRARRHRREPRGARPPELQLGGPDAAPRGRPRAGRAAPHRSRSALLGRFVEEDYGGETEGPLAVLDDFRFGRTSVRSVGGSLRRDRHAGGPGRRVPQLRAGLSQGGDGERREGRRPQDDARSIPPTPPRRSATTSRR